MPFQNLINQTADPILTQIYLNPFLIKLKHGNLEQEAFEIYLEQDYYYLLDYAAALTHLSNLAPSDADAIFLKDCALKCYQEPPMNISKVDSPQALNLTKACRNYLQFIKLHVKNDYRRGLSAVFPCFYIYFKVAKKLYPTHNSDNNYLSWFDTYVDPVFISQTLKILDIFQNEYMKADFEAQKEMLAIFKQGCIYEDYFWRDAYYRYGELL